MLPFREVEDMPYLRVCPFSVVVFIATVVVVTRQKRKQLRKDKENKAGFQVVFVLGAPGVGKGTQCQLLCSRLQSPQWVHLSAGELLRAERQKTNSTLADEINACIAAGKLVSSQITCQLLLNAMNDHFLQSPAPTHFLIDGFPRSQSNADEWIRTTAAANHRYQILFVLNFECPEETLIGRLLERGKSSGRTDDNLTTVQARFQTFQKETAPILVYYRQSKNVPVYTIAADQPVEAVYQDTVRYFQK